MTQILWSDALLAIFLASSGFCLAPPDQRVLQTQGLEFNPQRKLPHAVSSGVTLASGLHLSECALTQIVARIIEVRVVGNVGKAALELQLKPFRELEIPGEPQGEVKCFGANQRSHGSVAKAASNAGAAVGR
jgi:hypothetical protein